FKKNLNHTIAKDIVSTAKDTTQAIAIEDLDGIRKRGNPAGKAQRDSLDRWAFHELRSFIEYKAKLAGVPVYAVDSHHTSQMCPLCGHTSKAKRRTQADFACTRCGHTMNADLNEAINIQYRAAVNQPIALRPELSFREVGSASQPALAVGR
ncbi:MAG: transposase, partial [Candidatus Methanofastidiosa archaeon]|nr:transposase [Candidatus Methanofastidiosa archaeon]